MAEHPGTNLPQDLAAVINNDPSLLFHLRKTNKSDISQTHTRCGCSRKAQVGVGSQTSSPEF